MVLPEKTVGEISSSPSILRFDPIFVQGWKRVQKKMKSLASIFPRASKSFLNANPPLSPEIEAKMLSTASVGSGKGKRGAMNKTESEFALMLEAQKRAGEIERYDFQGITLRWTSGDDVIRYTPDFVVFEKTDSTMRNRHEFITRMRLIEIKGGYSKMPGFLERAVERFRHARTYWPQFQFELHKKTKNGWEQIY